MIHKACAVVLHPDGAPLRLLAFDHPAAGPQLVKGTVEAHETPERAAIRELWEEAGLESVAALSLGHSDEIAQNQRWHFVLCRAKPPIRDRWQHFCADNGGHLFTFFWFLPDNPPAFDPLFSNVFSWITAHL